MHTDNSISVYINALAVVNCRQAPNKSWTFATNRRRIYGFSAVNRSLPMTRQDIWLNKISPRTPPRTIFTFTTMSIILVHINTRLSTTWAETYYGLIEEYWTKIVQFNKDSSTQGCGMLFHGSNQMCLEEIMRVPTCYDCALTVIQGISCTIHRVTLRFNRRTPRNYFRRESFALLNTSAGAAKIVVLIKGRVIVF